MKPVFFLLRTCSKVSLASDIRQKGHITGLLYRESELALGTSRDAGALTSHDATVRVEKLLEKFNVLVVDIFDIVLLKEALFFHNSFRISC